MITLLGASGYIGVAFATELTRRGTAFTPLSRRTLDYTHFSTLQAYLRDQKPEFLINVAGYTGRPNVDECEKDRHATLLGNTILPVTVAHACAATNTPWAHISSGCIYSGGRVRDGAVTRVEPNLCHPRVLELLERNPEAIEGFTESDPPNFTFEHPRCSFYSGTKAMAETALAREKSVYIWRIRIPFDQFNNPRNYLTKILTYPKIYENFNSLSHRGDLVNACLDSWEQRVPFGVYNITNPGYVTSRQVVELIRKILHPGRRFEFWESDEAFYRQAARTPRSNCVLDASKLLATGVKLRPVEEALVHALKHWQPGTV